MLIFIPFHSSRFNWIFAAAVFFFSHSSAVRFHVAIVTNWIRSFEQKFFFSFILLSLSIWFPLQCVGDMKQIGKNANNNSWMNLDGQNERFISHTVLVYTKCCDCCGYSVRFLKWLFHFSHWSTFFFSLSLYVCVCVVFLAIIPSIYISFDMFRFQSILWPFSHSDPSIFPSSWDQRYETRAQLAKFWEWHKKTTTWKPANQRKKNCNSIGKTNGKKYSSSFSLVSKVVKYEFIRLYFIIKKKKRKNNSKSRKNVGSDFSIISTLIGELKIWFFFSISVALVSHQKFN